MATIKVCGRDITDEMMKAYMTDLESKIFLGDDSEGIDESGMTEAEAARYEKHLIETEGEAYLAECVWWKTATREEAEFRTSFEAIDEMTRRYA